MDTGFGSKSAPKPKFQLWHPVSCSAITRALGAIHKLCNALHGLFSTIFYPPPCNENVMVAALAQNDPPCITHFVMVFRWTFQHLFGGVYHLACVCVLCRIGHVYV